MWQYVNVSADERIECLSVMSFCVSVCLELNEGRTSVSLPLSPSVSLSLSLSMSVPVSVGVGIC